MSLKQRIHIQFSFFFFLALTGSAIAQSTAAYPPHWWAGMKNSTLQVMMQGKEIGKDNPSVQVAYDGITIQKVTYAENANYLFVDLSIAPNTKPGKLNFVVKSKGKPKEVPFEIKARREGKGTQFAQGVTASDFIYLIMPDRFSNGDPTNDRFPGMRDQSLNRDSIFHRHGGDLQGIINHLDYLQDLGVTALWLMPVLENDMPNRSEHGYAFTNHYKIEKRLGGEAAYKKLSDELHKRGMKLIQDAVYNHVGLYHHTVQDKPMKDWLHEWPAYTNTTYRDQALYDAYATSTDRKKLVDGWFTPMMPDLNHQNPFVANFLIQHALWCVEEFGVDAWRIDTYLYNDLEFMNRCNQALLQEYPNLHLFGETWVHGVVGQSFFTENNIGFSFKSNLPAVTDFQTNLYGITPALTQKFGWTEGVNKLYQTLAQDVVYKDPMKQVIFLDNHDLSRFYSVVGENVEKQKMGIGWLLTCRGIPQMYYGTEILMKGFTNPDGWVRLDFAGGWPGDKENKFIAAGRTEKEQEVFAFTKSLANFRKNSSAIKTGKLMQYQPDDGLYIYFRYDNEQTVMCIMNTNEKPKEIDFSKFNERTNGFKTGTNIVTLSSHDLAKPLSIEGTAMLILELKK